MALGTLSALRWVTGRCSGRFPSFSPQLLSGVLPRTDSCPDLAGHQGVPLESLSFPGHQEQLEQRTLGSRLVRRVYPSLRWHRSAHQPPLFLGKHRGSLCSPPSLVAWYQTSCTSRMNKSSHISGVILQEASFSLQIFKEGFYPASRIHCCCRHPGQQKSPAKDLQNIPAPERLH